MSAQNIGRFKVLRELGRGGQGAVYLAYDPQLDRQVAIKTLRNIGHSAEALMREALVVSKMQHANIIPLYDAGEHQGNPYLVYAYIEGETLAQKLKQDKMLSLVQAAEITCGVLEGLSYAHAQGVIHLDIKPGNVMLASGGLPMVMDFGLAQAISELGVYTSVDLSGTPHYMAPERISGKRIDHLADIYSVGVMLYEMVTGEQAVSGDSVYAVLNRAVHEEVVPPSKLNEQVDAQLEAIIFKAIAKNPDERYQDAAAMNKALQDYLGRKGAAKESSTHSTLEFLLRRMRSKSDFPALSSVISEINRIASSDSESPTRLARVILQDFALTNKLLKLVNTVSYGQFGGNINTISKAVVILGFDTVRNIATTLVLLEFMQNKAQSAQLKDEVLGAIFSGLVAARLSAEHNFGDAEEAMVCSMFHNLGRLLVTFYFFEESQEIQRLVEQGESEDTAASKVLGISLSQLGVGVARSWNFPPRLLAGMRKLRSEKITSPRDDSDRLTVTVNLANDLCAVAASTGTEQKEQALRELSERYVAAAKLSEGELGKALDHGLDELSRRSAILGISPSKSTLMKKVRKWSGYVVPEPQKKNGEASGVPSLEQIVEQQSAGKGEERRSPEDILGAGIQDVTASLVGDYNLNDLLQMVLETIYRGMGFDKAIFLIRDNKQNAMAARIGFGRGVEAIIPSFRFPLSYTADVFHLAISKGADILIEDTRAQNIAEKIPAWYLDSVNAPCFMLLPVMVKDKVIGLFYADMPEPNGLNMTKQQLALLKTLRNQAVLAIRQKV
jgi:serine/threonine protein kinase